MNFVKRAMCYVRRKSGKSVLLFFLFLVADITILGTLAILDTSSGINDEIRRQTNAKVVIENLEVNRSLTEQDYPEFPAQSSPKCILVWKFICA